MDATVSDVNYPKFSQGSDGVLAYYFRLLSIVDRDSVRKLPDEYAGAKRFRHIQ